MSEVLELSKICVNYLSANISILLSYAFSSQNCVIFDPESIYSIVKNSKRKFLPSEIIALQTKCPCLSDHHGLDIYYWKRQVEERYPKRPVLYPMSHQENVISSATSKLIDFCTLSEDNIISALNELCEVSFNFDLFKKTKVGVIVTESKKKSSSKNIIDKCDYLLDMWKKQHKENRKSGDDCNFPNWQSLYHHLEKMEESALQKLSAEVKLKSTVIKEGRATTQVLATPIANRIANEKTNQGKTKLNVTVNKPNSLRLRYSGQFHPMMVTATKHPETNRVNGWNLAHKANVEKAGLTSEGSVLARKRKLQSI